MIIIHSNKLYRNESVGRAYGFFYCDAPKQEIETELPLIRRGVKTPSELELSLTEGMDNIEGDEGLTALAQEAKEEGMNYMLQATYPNRTNKDAADEIAPILNQAYQSHLYKVRNGVKEEFRGEIVYEENGEYVFGD